MDRKAEVRELLRLTPEEVSARAGETLVVCEDLHALHRRFAQELADEIRIRNAAGEPTRLIVPVGPTGQYPILVDILERDGISLSTTWLFFMDEYGDETGRALLPEHPLSLQGAAQRALLARISGRADFRPEQVFFPGAANIDGMAAAIARVGGIDTCYGGIGIHGHIAFNEPEPGVSEMGPRRVHLNDYTVTINAIRAHVGGNLACFPRAAFTVGLREILASRRLRLYCRNGIALDWANTILRLALFGRPGDDFPVTHIRGHADVMVTTDRGTLASPQNLI